MTDEEFFEAARDVRFTVDQARFLTKLVSRRPHTHSADQIDDLHEAVTEIVEDMEDDQ